MTSDISRFFHWSRGQNTQFQTGPIFRVCPNFHEGHRGLIFLDVSVGALCPSENREVESIKVETDIAIAIIVSFTILFMLFLLRVTKNY